MAGRLTQTLDRLSRYKKGLENKAKGVEVKINRFPKMAILWYVVSRDILGLDDDLAKAAGYVVATYYAALKNMGRRGVRKSPKKQHDFSAPPKPVRSKPHLVIKFPFGLESPFDPDEKWISFDGKKYDAAKFDDYMKRKFGPRYDLYYEYVKFAESIVKEHPDRVFWNRRWFDEVWKPLRDLDWSEGQAKLF